jgi:hypothetical protein
MCHVTHGNAHATSWSVVGSDWIEVRRGATARYIATWPWWRGCVAFVGSEEMPWHSATCSQSLLKYIMRSFIPIPCEKLCKQKRVNNHSFVISPWVWWECHLWWHRGLVTMKYVMSQILPVAGSDWTLYCLELISHPSRSRCWHWGRWTRMQWTTY